MKARALLSALALALIAATVHGQAAPEKIRINIICDADGSPPDPVGSQFCSALRDAFARSPRYSAVGHDEPHFHYILSIVTTYAADGLSAQAVVLTYSKNVVDEVLMAAKVSVCGADTAREMGEQTMSYADGKITRLERN